MKCNLSNIFTLITTRYSASCRLVPLRLTNKGCVALHHSNDENGMAVLNKIVQLNFQIITLMLSNIILSKTLLWPNRCET